MRGDPKITGQSGTSDLNLPQAQERFDNIFYTKSDEKFVLRPLLDEIFGDRKFEFAMDVGPGAGHITEPLARRSRSLLLVEKSAAFQETLKQRFPDAQILLSPIEDVERDERFDIIVLAHVLYYHPAQNWLELLEKLGGMLSSAGEIVVILNADSGDWWRLLSAFWDELRPHIAFDYIPLSELRKQLSERFQLKAHPYRYHLWIESDAWCEVVGKRILDIQDEQILPSYARRFREFSSAFKQVDGSFVLDMRAQILRLSRK